MTDIKTPPPYSLGALPSPPDPRDYRYAVSIIPSALPSKYDLMQWEDPVYGQVGGSCAPNAAVGLRANVARRLGKDVKDHSRTWLYDWVRVSMWGIANWSGDTGSWPASCYDVLTKKGVCLESSWPESKGITTLPPTSLDAEAAQYEITQYARVSTDVLSVKAAIANNNPVSVAATLYHSFASPVNGVVPMPSAAEIAGGSWGGHAFVIVGYDDDKMSVEGVPGCFLIRNSWGTGWANGGYAWIPYAWFTAYVWETWTITDVLGTVPPPPPPPPQPITATLTVTPAKTLVPSANGTVALSVVTTGEYPNDPADATCPWTVTSGAQWITSPLGSVVGGNVGSYRVLLNVNQNYQAARDGKITITATPPNQAPIVKTVWITQAAPVLKVSPAKNNIAVDTSSADFTVTATCPWTVQSFAQWVTLMTSASGTAGTWISSFHINQNYRAARDGKIVFTTAPTDGTVPVSVVVYVTQAGVTKTLWEKVKKIILD